MHANPPRKPASVLHSGKRNQEIGGQLQPPTRAPGGLARRDLRFRLFSSLRCIPSPAPATFWLFAILDYHDYSGSSPFRRKASPLTRIALISDVHGNWPALAAVLDHARRHRVDQFLGAGDWVGGGDQSILARLAAESNVWKKRLFG